MKWILLELMYVTTEVLLNSTNMTKQPNKKANFGLAHWGNVVLAAAHRQLCYWLRHIANSGFFVVAHRAQ